MPESKNAPANKLQSLIRSGYFLNLDLVEAHKRFKEYRELFLTSEPFKSDQLLQTNLTQICNSTSDQFLNNQNDCNTHVFINYFSGLQRRGTYTAFGKHELTNLTGPNKSLETIIAESENNTFINNIKTLAQEDSETKPGDPFVCIQTVRGDGDCYYRSVMKAHIETILLKSEFFNRTLYFDHLIKTINEIVIKGNLFLTLEEQQKQKIRTLVAKFEQASEGTCWAGKNGFSEFEKDMSDETDDGLDYALVMSAKYLVGQYISDNRDLNANGLPMRLALTVGVGEPTDEAVDNIIKNQIVKKGVCAEGAHVHMSILPSLIGSEANLHTVSRDNPYDLRPGSEKLAIGYPTPEHKTYIDLFFRPGHYDYLRTLSNFEAREKQYESTTNKSQKPDLTKMQREFNRLLVVLQKKTDELIKKGAKDNLNDAQYKVAGTAATTLIKDLKLAQDKFFKQRDAVTPQQFELFKQECKLAISKAEKEFQKHRGWHAINPILREFLGILAVLTLIPALVVAATTKHGYTGTFFHTPKTDSAEQLAVFNEGFDQLQKP